MITLDNSNSDTELIILAAPSQDNKDYILSGKDVFDFQVDYARKIAAHDEVIVLTDKARYKDYVQALGKDMVCISPMQDVCWLRDFSFLGLIHPMIFEYSAVVWGEGTNRKNRSNEIQLAFIEFVKEFSIFEYMLVLTAACWQA